MNETIETGWLIESNHIDGTPHWFFVNLVDDGGDWTKDSVEALRLSRKQDAQSIIDYYGLTEAFPTEHQWGW